ncbi:MAG: Co2+/Mg2+ efflux protein ApaG [Flavobacteriaceae bacterium]|jgi:ApaG protein|nr:Co2+/Mg2+ efflux protein ApaG [Flavobacteriaceae bacterium]MBT6128051.1 Co2+/Mg2+ efflux protein ApaG [Flavobacteriaceae bacterium]MDG1028415.1 Co2+/Mg2+ efflux protein ApaG [Flavobacteriaceae bacterium]MDG1942608.1 Co2+/Mg2+ efflux protein ApaG [Flavobacteriaceae bacterium]|tara:strand:- start:233 stop:619 length:387 start_codon:yes stop_codon:yes gene_type:complete
MIQQVTRGIKISVETDYEGSFLKDNVLHYAFTYRIEIENQSKSSVQLLTRHWKIKEALNKTQYVNGNGVVGKKPVINPGEIHKYKSGCLLSSAVGAMKGAYIMIDFSSTKKFNVEIPPFKLSAPFVLN